MVARQNKRRIFALLCAAFAVYTGYVYTLGTEIAGSHPLTAEVEDGLALFQDSNCIACHQFYGLGGYMGPDLTNVVSAPGKGVQYARAFIQFGTASMPDYGFDETQVDCLIEFLAFVDASGEYPPQQPRINWYGTVDYEAARDLQ